MGLLVFAAVLPKEASPLLLEKVMFSTYTEEQEVLLRMHTPMLQVPLLVISVSFSSLELAGHFTVYLVDS